MSEEPFITFPAGILGPAPVRVQVLASHVVWYALAKPAGIFVSATSSPRGTRALAGAIREAISAGKRQLSDLGIRRADVIHDLDGEATGVVVFGNDPAATAVLRNALGSGQFEFTYRLFCAATKAGPDADVLECDLPLATPPADGLSFVSHRQGKKCVTRFRRTEGDSPAGDWIARTSYCRFHQIRVHAAESGLQIRGETTYRSPGTRGPSESVERVEGVCDPAASARLFLHLESVHSPTPDDCPVTVRAPLPEHFATVLRRAGQRWRNA